MLDFTKKISGVLQNFLNKKTPKPIEKETIRQQIDTVISSLEVVVNTLQSLSDSEKIKLKNKMDSLQPKRIYVGPSVYYGYVGKLNGAAYRVEKNLLFDSVLDSTKTFIKVLKKLDINLNKIVDTNSISIYNSKVSTMAVLGLINDGEILANWSLFLFDAIAGAVSISTFKPIKYREIYLLAHEETIVKIVNISVGFKQEEVFFNLLAELEKSGQDVYVVNSNGDSNLALIEPTLVKLATKGMFGEIFTNLNIFRILGESWNLMQHTKFLRLQREKEWMEAHVALLKLQLNDVDEDSPEYTNLTKIIDSYSNQIAKADQKLNQYIEG